MIVDRALLLEMMRRGVEYVQLPALHHPGQHHRIVRGQERILQSPAEQRRACHLGKFVGQVLPIATRAVRARGERHLTFVEALLVAHRSEEHTSELQSLMRISYAV